MFGLNKYVFIIAILATVFAIVCAILPGVSEYFRSGRFGEYIPNLAILTITLIAIIWYTAFTSQSILLEKKREEAKSTSLATAILGELSIQFMKYQKFTVISEEDQYSPKNDSFETPVLENIIKSEISYLPSSVTESLSTFFYENQRLISELDKGLNEEKRHELRGTTADLASHVCEIVEKLENIGGVLPIHRNGLPRSHGNQVLPENFPKNPFKET